MAKEGGYTIDDIYQGGYSSLNPERYGNIFTGYRVDSGSLGMSTDARTANIIKEVSKNLSAGAKTVELTQIFPEVFEAIPKQEFKELNRLIKLTGVDATVHAPLIEPSGMTKEGFSEATRRAAELQMLDAVEKAHEINPDGSFPVTFHSSVQLPGEIVPKGEKTVPETFVINTETGSVNRIPVHERYFGEKQEPSVKKELDTINDEQWKSQLSHISYYSNIGGEHAKEGLSKVMPYKLEGQEVPKEIESEFKRDLIILRDCYRDINNLYEIAYRNCSDEERKRLEKWNQEVKEKIEEIKKNPQIPENVRLQKEIIDQGIEILGNIKQPPQIFKPLGEYAKERSIDTFSNVALESYKKFKGNSPIISIENPPVGGAFSTGEELKDIVEKAREKFIEKAKDKLGLSESEAKREAERLIGVTWDVGHINMLRKHGYEEKDIIKETEAVAPLVKHVHLSDNFGFEHTELPMGMGNVPIKEIMEKLGKQGYKGKKIIEAMSWWQHFSEQGAIPPLKPTLEAFGTSFYPTGLGPYWNAALGFQQGYFSGYGPILPQGNYNTFGGGFSTLPAELGGQIAGAAGSRMSGKPME